MIVLSKEQGKPEELSYVDGTDKTMESKDL